MNGMLDAMQPMRPPACVNCARRKIKCDREAPCSSCVASKIQCRHVQKQMLKKRNVLHSTRYEESLTGISHQIEALSNTLQSILNGNATSSRSISGEDMASFMPANIQAPSELPSSQESMSINVPRDYEGESSFHTQSRKITDILSLAATSPSDTVTATSAAAIRDVHILIQDIKAASSPMFEQDLSQSNADHFSLYPELADLRLPLMDSVLRLLAFAKVSPQSYFWKFSFVEEECFAELCQKLYFPTQSFTIFAWIRLNCGLFYLFRDLDRSHYNKLCLTEDQVSKAVATCSNNLDKAVRSLRLCSNASMDAVEALVSAAAVNMENAEGYVSWKLSSAAARMSIDLGYHHLPHGYGDHETSQKRKIFWFVYSMDKSLAFNFGRSPIIQDDDVTTERPTLSVDFKDGTGHTFLGFIDFARLQFAIYKQLFTANARQEPQHIRTQRVHEFAAQLSVIGDAFRKAVVEQDTKFRDASFSTERCFDIGIASILTLVYRMLPPDLDKARDVNSTKYHPLRFHSLCVEAGRSALHKFVCAWDMISSNLNQDAAKLFINWTMRIAPFMPYIVVIGNQIATGDQQDLILLRDTVRIVETAAATSNAMKKMHKTFSLLLKISELWTSMKAGSKDFRSDHNLQTDSTMLTMLNQDAHLSIVTHEEQQSSDTMEIAELSWQDLGRPQYDWNAMFDEFDLGLGAESAREMIPWFVQHAGDLETYQ